jgi:drug/metabolite transporter (DMT)-like permease
MTAPTFEPAHPISASKALALAALGMGALSAMDAVAKGLGADFPVTQVVAMRYFSAALWLALFIAVTRRAWPQRRFIGRHLVRAALMSLTAFLFFYAITHLPLAVATALVMSSPVYVALLGIVFLKEPARASIGLAIIVGLVGAAVIIGWGGDTVSATGETSPLAWAAALLAPLSYAVGIVLLKHHSADENAAAITLAQSVLATLIVLPFALPTFAMPEGGQWFSVGLVGLLGAGGYLLFIAALRHLPTSVFALVDYTSLLWAAGLGYLFFAEVPGINLWIGGGLIVLACFMGMRAARQVTPPSALQASVIEPPSSSES